MNQEQQIIGYDEFMPQPLQERLRIFNEVSAENRALLMKTHIERWLAANESRLNGEQIAIVEEMLLFITPELYQEERDIEKIHPEIEALRRKGEAVFSREELRQILTRNADYVPRVETKKD
jgi:hypothetical protein